MPNAKISLRARRWQRGTRYGAWSRRAIVVANAVPSQRETSKPSSRNLSETDKLSPDRECVAPVANCGKTSVTEKTTPVVISPGYIAARLQQCIPIQRPRHAELRKHCRPCDSVSRQSKDFRQ